jgi:hypothetical protein
MVALGAPAALYGYVQYKYERGVPRSVLNKKR